METSRQVDLRVFTDVPTRTASLTFDARANHVGVSIDRSGWMDDTATVEVMLEAFLDGTWIVWCGFTTQGGGGSGLSTAMSAAPPAGTPIRVRTTTNGKSVQQRILLRETNELGAVHGRR